VSCREGIKPSCVDGLNVASSEVPFFDPAFDFLDVFLGAFVVVAAVVVVVVVPVVVPVVDVVPVVEGEDVLSNSS
jgi:hypothetical protein